MADREGFDCFFIGTKILQSLWPKDSRNAYSLGSWPREKSLVLGRFIPIV
jgi:hypothetical protein